MWILLSVTLAFVVLTECYLGPNQHAVHYQRGKGEERIVNGDTTERHEFPWMKVCGKKADVVGNVEFVYAGDYPTKTALRCFHLGTNYVFIWAMISDKLLMNPGCGATLINKRFVLTAAHCVIGHPTENPRIIRIRLGMHNHTWLDDPDVYASPVRRIIRHPEYVTGHIHDFTLIELAEDIDVSEKIKPICLPQTDKDFSGEMATIVGWGRTAHGGTRTELLQKAEVPVIDQERCRDLYDPSPIMHDMLCAGLNGKDACQYDSGGPLMWKDGSGVWRLIGVVSWGRSCADPIYPGVYARVSSVMPWISSVIGDDYC